MWNWLKFSFRVYLAYLTAQIVIWLALVTMVFVVSGGALLITWLLEH